MLNKLMLNKLMPPLTHSIFKVMETMFSLTVEEQKKTMAPLQAKESQEGIQASSITFSGSFSGTIFLEIPLNLLKIMTENFLGQSLTHLSEDYMEGTLKEALNMIAGDALTQINANTGLGLPEIIPVSSLGQVDQSIRFNTPYGTITAHIRLA